MPQLADDRFRSTRHPISRHRFGDQAQSRNSTVLAPGEQAAARRRDVRGLPLGRPRGVSTGLPRCARGGSQVGVTASGVIRRAGRVVAHLLCLRQGISVATPTLCNALVSVFRVVSPRPHIARGAG
jgi:hypothetical protein